jgi:hypothetical protein
MELEARADVVVMTETQLSEENDDPGTFFAAKVT